MPVKTVLNISARVIATLVFISFFPAQVFGLVLELAEEVKCVDVSSVILSSVAIHPESMRIVYVIQKDGEQHAVIDGQEGKGYNYIKDIVFSPAGDKLAYCAGFYGDHRDGTGASASFIINDVERVFDYFVGAPVFSPDGNRVAYRVRQSIPPAALNSQDHRQAYNSSNVDSPEVNISKGAKRNSSVVISDGLAGFPYEDGVSNPIFSPDGQKLVYWAKSKGKSFIVTNGVEGKSYDKIGTIALSPDNKKIAYAARAGSKYFVVLDGAELPRCDGIGDIIFSPDGHKLAYVSWNGEKGSVVVDGKEGPPYDWNGGLVFCPDSTRLAYRAWRGEKWCIVLNGTEGEKYDWVSPVTFSPNGKRIAYVAKRGEKRMVVVDAREGKGYDRIATGINGDIIYFSPDNEKIAYGAKQGRKWFVVVNGVEGNAYDLVLPGCIFFVNKNTLCLLAVRDGFLYQVTYHIKD